LGPTNYAKLLSSFINTVN